MATYTVKLDPSAVATNRTEFNINTGGIRVAGSGIDWGDAAIQAFLADLKFGSVPVDYRVPNRQVTIPLTIFTTEDGTAIEETVRRQLAEKVGLLHAEGGWLLRQRATGVPMYAEVVDAVLHVADQWGETGAIEPDVNLVLQCLPDFFGDEVSSDTMTGTQFIDSLIKQSGVAATVAGDYPARTRIVITDTSGHDQHGIYLGLRSKYYDSATSAAIVTSASGLQAINGSTKPTQTGTVGGNVVQNTFVRNDGWLPIVQLSTATGPWTHKGTYRVLVRVQGVSVPTRLQLMWQPGTLTGVPEMNDPVYIPGDATVDEGGTNYYMVDLGEVRLDPQVVSGTSGWYGAIQALADSGTANTVNIDSVYMLPLDDGAGRLSIVKATPSFATAQTSITSSAPASELNDTTIGTTGYDWVIPGDARASISKTVSGGFTATTRYYKATAFGFSVPSTATILGVQVGVKRYVNGAAFVYDNRIRMVVGATIVTPGKSTSAQWPTSGKWTYFGGPTDLWGQTLTPTIVNNAVAGNFGFVVSAVAEVLSSSHFELFIQGANMTIYYALASGLVVAQDAVVYANQKCEVRTEGAWHYDASGNNAIPVRVQEIDSLRLPPSLAEGRQCELFVDTSRGNLADDPDTNLDALSAQVFWRPCYIERP